MKETLLYETHSHTPLCGHAWGEPEAYAERAAERGLKGLIITCHNPMPDGYGANVRMAIDDFPRYLELVERAREAMEGVAEVRLGLECDYYPGAESWLEKQIASAPFDYIIGSVHPHVAEYRKWYFKGDWADFQRLYFEHLALAADSGLFDSLAHPDLVKNLAPHEWNVERMLTPIRSALDRIAKTGTAMELNTSGAFKEYPEMNPGSAMLREMRERDIPVVIGADAHTPDRVGDRFEEAMDALEDAGYDRARVFLERKPMELSLEEARASLRVVA